MAARPHHLKDTLTFPYHGDTYPSFPVMKIALARPDESFSIGPLVGLIDSGADSTIFPARLLRPLLLPPSDRKFLRSPWGDRHVVDVYLLDVGIGHLRFPAIEVVADEIGDEVVVGRNLLNLLRVMLDGRAQLVTISE